MVHSPAISSARSWHESPIVVAEIGCNHGGSMDVARDMILAARYAGADYAKFQKRDIELRRADLERIPRTDPHAFGPTEYLHRKALEFTIEQHAELKRFCEANGIGYACSAWDETSFVQLVELNCDYIKVPSAKNLEWRIWNNNPRPDSYKLHISLGMTTASDRELIFSELSRRGMVGRSVVYACVAKYPAEPADQYLGEITDIKSRGFVAGFSGHHKGIAIDVGAMMLGARWIERHFTLDRTAKGTDHAASLEPEGLRRLTRDLSAIYMAIRNKPDSLPECEVATYRKFKGN